VSLIDDVVFEQPPLNMTLTGEDVARLDQIAALLSLTRLQALSELIRRALPPQNGQGFHAICDHCGLPYTSFHRPALGRKHYCSRPECKREAAADRARRYRDRRRV